MEKFKSKLNEVIEKVVELSEEWDNLRGDEYERANDTYTLKTNFEQMIRDFVEWKSNLEE